MNNNFNSKFLGNLSRNLILISFIANAIGSMNLLKASASKKEINSHQALIEMKDINPQLISQRRKVKQYSDKSNDFTIQSQQTINLEDLERLINENSFELEILRARIEEAKFLLKSEVSAWYPKLNLSSTGFPQYLKGDTYNKLSTDTSNNQSKASLKATLKWDLINPSRVPQITNAKEKLEQARISYAIKYRDLVLSANNHFFDLQRSLQDIEIGKQAIKASEITLKELTIKFESGLASKLDVLQAKKKIAQDKQFLVEKIGAKKINERKFAQLLNLNSDTNPKVDMSPNIIGLWRSSLEESILYAFQSSQEIDQLLIKKLIAKNNAKIALAGIKPTVSIYNTLDTSLSKGEVGVASPRSANNINTYNNTIGLQFNWPMYDGGSSQAQYKANKKKINEIDSELLLEKTKIRQEVEELFFKLYIARENIKNSFESINSAKESLRISRLRLDAGITTQEEVVKNQKDLTEAQVKHMKTIADYNKNLVGLKIKTGFKQLQKCVNKDFTSEILDSYNSNRGNSSKDLEFKKDSCMDIL